jgi:hypothetical protein
MIFVLNGELTNWPNKMFPETGPKYIVENFFTESENYRLMVLENFSEKTLVSLDILRSDFLRVITFLFIVQFQSTINRIMNE